MTTFDAALAIIHKAKTIPPVVDATTDGDRLTVVFAEPPPQTNAALERAGYWVIRTEWAAYGHVWVVIKTDNEEDE